MLHSAITFVFPAEKTFHQRIRKPRRVITFLAFLFIEMHSKGRHQRFLLLFKVDYREVYS